MAEENQLADGSTNFLGGQDASNAPSEIPPNTYAAGINVSVQQGKPRPRWGMQTRDLLTPIEGGIKTPTLTTTPFEDILFSGKFQGAIPYSIGQEFFQVVIVSGCIFMVNQTTFKVTPIEIKKGGRLDPTATRVYWSPAGRFLVIFDFPARPVIVEGMTARRADPEKNEVPVSVLGAYNQNRLFIANAGNEFTAGDPAGSLAAPDAPITFNEVIEANTGFTDQIFQLSTNYNNDPITAMAFLQQADTGTGIGTFLVATRRAVYAYLTQQPRTEWKPGQFGSNFIYNTGIAGQQAFTNVMSDLYFISPDGQLRTASMSREEQGRWSKIPISREVQNWLIYRDRNLTQYVNLVYFKNKILVTANPYRTGARDTQMNPVTDLAFGGMVVLELDNISKLGQTGQPAWAGLWTGARPMQLLENDDRLFMWAKEGERNQLYEVRPDLTLDLIHGRERYIRSRIYTRQYVFENPFQNKEIHSMDVNINELEGDLKLDVKYRNSETPEFQDWRTFEHVAPYRTCGIPEGDILNGFGRQGFSQLVLGDPDPSNQNCNPVTRLLSKCFRKLQLMITITARHWELQEFRIKAVARPQAEIDNLCQKFPEKALPSGCNDDWSIPENTLCPQTRS